MHHHFLYFVGITILLFGGYACSSSATRSTDEDSITTVENDTGTESSALSNTDSDISSDAPENDPVISIIDDVTEAVIESSCPAIVNDGLSDALGCDGVFNPGQVLDYHIVINENDWNALLQDPGPEFTYYPAEFSCGDETPITVGVRKKRSGGSNKVGLKIDMNQQVDDQEYHTLKKLSFENGVSEGETEDNADIETLLSEYLAWRLMSRACVMSCRASFVNVNVNGERLGAFINVEQVDKRFLITRLGDDTGWLYKKSGSIGDGLKTHETDGLVDPYADYFCFFGVNGCAAPTADVLETELPDRLDIEQMLKFGAVNALMANTDGPLLKDNNYYYYDWGINEAFLPRVYFPWDLDTAMNSNFNVFTGTVPGGVSWYTDALFPTWSQDYVAMMQELVSTSNSLSVVEEELTNAVDVAGGNLEADPYLNGTAQTAADKLTQWWSARLTAVQEQIDQQ
ncbi:MAG: CotH kinase family protein [Deltaproteobacteria bacterium]|nr:CotH kinase family protein [Deltaproteobacteria bacterium]MBN2674534.1 CotH kinase family protein [Deltaproteobacteria bacterium]